MLIRVLLSVEPKSQQKRLARLITSAGAVVSQSGKPHEFWERLSAETFDLIVVSREILPEPEDQTIASIRRLPDAPDAIIVWDKEDPEERACLITAGCLAVVYSKLADHALKEEFRTLIERRSRISLQGLQVQKAQTRHRLSDFVSSSPAMQNLLNVAQRVTHSDTSLLILGETGVGKEWLARAIHEEGARSQEPFVAVNCGAIPETLLESELFGHEEGAFTGASRAHRGHFELAHRGTIFLDEIAEMPNHLQVKLLRVLQEQIIQRLGSEKRIALDVRVIAATNKDPEEEIREKRLRSDLYYRLGVVTLVVPPLRERRKDIPELVNNYLEIFRVRLGRDVESVDRHAMKALSAYDWPGNVRELINVMERAVLLCSGPRIGTSDLPQTITIAGGGTPLPTASTHHEEATLQNLVRKPLRTAKREVISSFERTYLSALLKQTHGRIGETAKLAGITPRALFEKMRSHGLRKENFGASSRESEISL